MLCAVGDLIEDVVAHLDGPIRVGADANSRITRHRGGSAANVAAAAARLTGRSRFVGAIGDDSTGTRLVEGLDALGVDCVVQRGGITGAIVALVDDTGERTFVTDRGAAAALRHPGDDVLDGVTVLHLPGYGLAGGDLAPTVLALAAAARTRGIPVAFDPSSTTIGADLGVDAYRAAIASLAPDVILPNELEAGQLDLVDRPLAVLTVVTAGAKPTTVVRADPPIDPRDPGIHSAPGADREHVAVATLSGPMVDSTGAGDAFAAAFLTSWIDDGSVDDAVLAGHAAAARVLAGPGGDHWS